MPKSGFVRSRRKQVAFLLIGLLHVCAFGPALARTAAAVDPQQPPATANEAQPYPPIVLALATSATSTTQPHGGSGNANAQPPAGNAPLRANGLTAQATRGLERGLGVLGKELADVGRSTVKVAALAERAAAGAGHSASRGFLQEMLYSLALTFIVGLAIELLARLLLKPIGRMFGRRAHPAASRENGGNHPEKEYGSTHGGPVNPLQAGRVHDIGDKIAAGMRPSSDRAAIVRSLHDGIETVRQVDVGAHNAGSGAKDPEPAPARSLGPDAASTSRRLAGTHRRNLWHLWLGIRELMLDLLPLLAFLVSSAFVLRFGIGGDATILRICTEFVDAYVISRALMAFFRLLISPRDERSCLLQLPAATAASLQRRARFVVVSAAFGIALANAAGAAGIERDGRLAILKLVVLLMLLSSLLLIAGLRRPIMQLAASRNAAAEGVASTVRNFVVRYWAFAAAAAAICAWIAWARDIEAGLARIVHFVLVTVAILMAARVSIILAHGAVARALDMRSSAHPASPWPRLLGRYLPHVQRALSVLIVGVACLLLLHEWGVDTAGWFGRGSLGRGLAKAGATILVALVAAIAIWEAAGLAIERRIKRWSAAGERLRAARLKTLLPIIRTCLLAAMAIIVAMTALNELGVNTAPLLAGASIIGVALGFGSQKLVQDFITGVFLLMENAMRVGDSVTVAGLSGTVEYLSVRSVRLRGGDGSLYTVPFSSVTTVNNSNRGLGNAGVQISVSYDTDINQVFAELKKIGEGLREDPAFKASILHPIEIWGVDSVNGAMVTVIGQIQCTDAGRWGVQREMNRRILERFRELHIEIANPKESVLISPGRSGEPSAEA